ncbi:MAG TPA: CBS domain-containing protein [Allosphingosinicella sp.]|uniref:CBS domain-containing protein n=1 Tax=Allosphingosinicella sp. TaxID=2823234 RepID=UPI002EDB88D2
MKVAECMSPDVETISPEQPVGEAAQLMLREDAGAIPVGEGDRLVGMITDRDIAVRGVAEGRGPDTPVRELMTDEVLFCFDDQNVEDAALLMSDHQVRRLPVKSREDERLVGIVSLADISRSEQGEAASVALGGITDPGGEHNQSAES